jgi:hypothetical protein
VGLLHDRHRPERHRVIHTSSLIGFALLALGITSLLMAVQFAYDTLRLAA